jgi:M6 family metalloprotease-like protein
MWMTDLTPTGDQEKLLTTHLAKWIGVLTIGCLGSLVWVVICALWSASASAAPAAPVEVTLEQPGGRTFAAKPWGDEWTNGFETLEGFTVVRSRESGAWEYAVKGPKGGLRASGQSATLEDPPSAADEHLRPEETASNVPSSPGLGSAALANAPSQGGSALESSTLRSSALASPNTGVQRSLVILVKFTNQAPVGSKPAQWRDRFFGDFNSVRDYYGEVSYGKLDIAPAAESHRAANDGVVGWLALDRKHPNTAGNTGIANRLLTRDAVRAANRYVNFKAYDTNRDGYLSTKELHVTVIVAGRDASFGGGGRSVWAHWDVLNPGEQPTVDGVVFGDDGHGGAYTQFGEWHGDHMATIGIMAHEIGHDLNLPDLYDVDGSSEGVGEWSVMSTGCWLELPGAHPGSMPAHPDAFSKTYEGWLAPVRVSGTGVATSIPQAETSATAIQLRDNPFGVDWTWFESPGRGEYFLVENRQRVGYDAALPGAGLLVWHIDETQTASFTANADETRKLVDLEEADGLQNLDTSRDLGGNRGDGGDPFPGTSGKALFNATSDPDSKLYGGSSSGVAMSNISGASSTMSATITAP